MLGRSKRVEWGISLAGVALAAAVVSVAGLGTLEASNMGFKFAYTMDAADGGVDSLDGTNTIALPYFPDAGIVDASALLNDIEAKSGVSVINIQRFRREDNGLEVYSGARGQIPFSLDPGVGYRVRVAGDLVYTLVGAHDPAHQVSFLAGDGGTNSLDGTNEYAPPYHGTAEDASDLRNELGPGNVVNIQEFRRSDNGITAYSGSRGQIAFPILPGRAYRVRVTTDLSFVPSHF